MRNEIYNVLNGLRRNPKTKDEYVEVVKDLEVPKVEIPIKEERLLKAMAQVGKSHRMGESNYPSSLDPEEMIDWIDEIDF